MNKQYRIVSVVRDGTVYYTVQYRWYLCGFIPVWTTFNRSGYHGYVEDRLFSTIKQAEEEWCQYLADQQQKEAFKKQHHKKVIKEGTCQ